ncbi:MAG: indolepyruvate oxidoreductase subunit beta [Deltaproteobacteria bacterium]|jgi:indolepyruvate ferredoxin oxidoreductase beta subunit|nr:indolepyruvate oxidoreductase subunit beta [Deltaproteobacteria bacterium]
MTGVGGQGTLTATTLLAKIALDRGLEVVSGEVHGMAQRGGVVESTLLIGGWRSPRIAFGEADLLLGFEPLETLRALPYLAPGGRVFSSSEALPPIGVALKKDVYPDLDALRATVRAAAKDAFFLPCRSLGIEAGSSQSGNSALLGAVCAAGVLPFGLDALEAGIRKHMPAKITEVNLTAARLGAAWH